MLPSLVAVARGHRPDNPERSSLHVGHQVAVESPRSHSVVLAVVLKLQLLLEVVLHEVKVLLVVRVQHSHECFEKE